MTEIEDIILYEVVLHDTYNDEFIDSWLTMDEGWLETENGDRGVEVRAVYLD